MPSDSAEKVLPGPRKNSRSPEGESCGAPPQRDRHPGLGPAGNWWLLTNTNTGGSGTNVDFFWGMPLPEPRAPDARPSVEELVASDTGEELGKVAEFEEPYDSSN